MAHDEVRSNSSRGHRVLVEASIEADGRQGARNTGRMTFNDTPSGSASPRVIGSPFVPERPALCAQAIIDRSGAANLIVLLRVRMGFPAESFALAARPLIDGYAEFVQLRPMPGSGRYGGPGGQLQRGLVTALRALDHRRGQILPRNAPPEILGALAHRWTYAVFAAALLRDVGGGPSDDSVRMFERWVPPIVQAWLAEHPPLMAELRAVLAGCADASSAIAELVERAATGARPRGRGDRASCADGVDLPARWSRASETGANRARGRWTRVPRRRRRGGCRATPALHGVGAAGDRRRNLAGQRARRARARGRGRPAARITGHLPGVHPARWRRTRLSPATPPSDCSARSCGPAGTCGPMAA
ncbi:MAG: TraI domain-containing protein [Desulfosudis oleivorans]|nr:TraI domain-containing protein [Desulfosudis oleivorans]